MKWISISDNSNTFNITNFLTLLVLTLNILLMSQTAEVKINY